jgi:uncharacterized protein YdeI (YjbR/CyaY-like superfamily)
MTITEVIFPKSRQEWRAWLTDHFETATEVWVAIPKKDKPLDYNDIIEEALCFNWIDSTLKTLDDHHTAQRMSPRKIKGSFSQLNLERIRLVLTQNLVHPRFVTTLAAAVNVPFVYPEDILAAIRQNEAAWEHFQAFSEPYKRIKVASIALAREDPSLFEKRLSAFVDSCIKNKRLKGAVGMEKYY